MDKCEICGGNNARRAEIIAKEGETTSRGRTTGVGIGSGGVGLGVANTSSTARTTLSKEVDFDHEGSFLGGFQLIFSFLLSVLLVGFPLIFLQETIYGRGHAPIWTDVLFSLIAFFLFMFLFPFLNSFGFSKRDAREDARKWATYKRTWVCLDCGHQWERKSGSRVVTKPSPSATKPVETLPVSALVALSFGQLESKDYRKKRSLLNQMIFPAGRLPECTQDEREKVLQLYQTIIEDLPNVYTKDTESKTLATKIKKFRNEIDKVKKAIYKLEGRSYDDEEALKVSSKVPEETKSAVERIETLQELLAKGLITDEEFSEKREKLIGEL